MAAALGDTDAMMLLGILYGQADPSRTLGVAGVINVRRSGMSFENGVSFVVSGEESEGRNGTGPPRVCGTLLLSQLEPFSDSSALPLFLSTA